jgi:uncharacterized protein YajQ (UPF0234 family)
MPSFDVVSEIDMHEVTNAIDQANREVANRFDFKGTNAKYLQDEALVTLVAQAEIQLRQMLDILRLKLTKRGVDIACMQVEALQMAGKEARQTVILRHGLEALLAKKIIKAIKNAKLKVQASVQGEKIRVSGKKRDDLQQVIALLREGEFNLPLQFENFRD